MSIETIDFILQILTTQNGKNSIQYDVSIDTFHFDLVSQWEKTTQICFFVNFINQKSTLAIIDFQKKYFVTLIHWTVLQNMMKFLHHFRIVWKLNLPHDIVNSSIDSSVAIINFIDQYLKKQTINAPLSPTDYRSELKHRILRTSKNMSKACIICGTHTKGAWVQCDCCNRWTHCECVQENEEELKDDTIHYFCIICVANTTQTEHEVWNANLTPIAEDDEPNITNDDAGHHRKKFKRN